MIKEGTYRARCTGPQHASFAFSKNGTEQLALHFALLDDRGQPTGDYLSWIGFFTAKAIERTRESLRYCGWTGDDLSDLSGVDANEVDLVVKHEEYDGKTYARVAFINRPGGGRVKFQNEMSPAQRKAFAERMRGAFVADAKPQPTRPPAMREPGEDFDDLDL